MYSSQKHYLHNERPWLCQILEQFLLLTVPSSWCDVKKSSPIRWGREKGSPRIYGRSLLVFENCLQQFMTKTDWVTSVKQHKALREDYWKYTVFRRQSVAYWISNHPLCHSKKRTRDKPSSWIHICVEYRLRQRIQDATKLSSSRALWNHFPVRTQLRDDIKARGRMVKPTACLYYKSNCTESIFFDSIHLQEEVHTSDAESDWFDSVR